MSTRTFTYKINMDLEGVKKGSKTMQVTLASMQGDSQKTNESMQRLADTIGKQYGINAKVATDNTNSFKNAIRQAARESNKAEKAYEQITREFNLMKQSVGLTSDEIQVLNAQFRLGSGATQKQKDEIAKLVTEYQQLRNAANKTQGSMRGFRGQMSNIGFQLQDIAVQAQMGTNAMVILGQQGSQLAAGFGPTGALVGAGIAFGAMLANVLSPNLFKTSEATRTLTDDLKELARTNQLTTAQASSLILKTEDEIKENNKKIESLKKQKAEIGNLTQTYEEYEKAMLAAAVAAGGVGSRQTGLNTLTKSQEEFNKAQEEAARKAVDLQAEIDTLTIANKKASDNIKLYKAAVQGSVSETERLTEANKNLTSQIVEQARAVSMNSLEMLEYKKKTDLATLAQQNAKAEQIAAVEASYDLLIATEKVNEAKSKQQKIDSVLLKYSPTARLNALKKQYDEELALAGSNQEAINGIVEYYSNQRLAITGSEWERYALKIRETVENTDQIMTMSLDRLVGGFGTAMTDIVMGSKKPAEALKDMFAAAIGAMVQFFAEWAAQKLLLFALDKTLNVGAQSSAAALMGANTGAKVAEAGLNAFAATAAIPIIGPALAPEAAAAATAAATPMAATATTLASMGIAAFDKGGFIPAGGAGIVSEIGDELVGGTMVYNGSQNSLGVTGREQTARIMSGSTLNFNITSNGNATPEAITRALMRALKRKSKALDTQVFDAMNRGRTNRGKRFNA